MKKKHKRAKFPKTFFVLFDADGIECGIYFTKEDAKDGAWGPRSRPGSSVVEYERKKKAKVTKV